MLGWFRTAAARKLAEEIADEYLRLQRSVEVRRDSPRKRQERHARLFDKIRAAEREKKLNVLQRAVFLQALRARLTEGGVAATEAAEFVAAVTASPLR